MHSNKCKQCRIGSVVLEIACFKLLTFVHPYILSGGGVLEIFFDEGVWPKV